MSGLNSGIILQPKIEFPKHLKTFALSTLYYINTPFIVIHFQKNNYFVIKYKTAIQTIISLSKKKDVKKILILSMTKSTVKYDS